MTTREVFVRLATGPDEPAPYLRPGQEDNVHPLRFLAREEPSPEVRLGANLSLWSPYDSFSAARALTGALRDANGWT